MNKHIKSMLEKCPDNKVFSRFKYDGDIVSTKWLPLKEWYNVHKHDPTDYVILPNEIVLETDFNTEKENKEYYENTTKPLLALLGIEYITAFSGGKSYHTHIITEDKLSFNQKGELVKRWFGEEHPFDRNLLNGTHGIRFIGAKHPITGMAKVIYERYIKNEGINKIDISNIPRDCYKADIINCNEALNIAKCPLMFKALNSKFPEGMRNNVLVPNFLALNPSEEEIKAFASAQEMRYDEVVAWLKSPKYKHCFNCKQLRYAYSELEEICAEGSCPYYNMWVK